VGAQVPARDERPAVERAIADLTLALRHDRAPSGDEEVQAAEARRLVVATIVTTLRRCLAAVTPPEQLTMRVT
ncbi:hypothetical protein, partial [Cellulomonas bogoriensis]|uniref:hypothetical protein n=1 Tax=Cellulomonas bogoriensis TaxID=301388 RepID=UPI00054DE3CC